MKRIKLEETTISSQQVFKGDLLNVFKDAVALPDGRQASREFIKHPGAVAVVPFTEDGQIIMVRQFRYPLGMEMLEIPAGKLDPGETPEECALREVAEETGFSPRTLRKIGPIHTTPGFSDEVIHLYLAQDLVPSDKRPDEDEFLKVETYTPAQLRKMIAEGVISDAKSIIALLLASENLKKD